MIQVQVTSNEFTRVVRNLYFISGELSVVVEVTREDLQAIRDTAEAELANWQS